MLELYCVCLVFILYFFKIFGKCYTGWLLGLQVVMVNQSGGQLACEYGSTGRDKTQNLVGPICLSPASEGHFLVVDYYQHRIHLLTNNLQFVRHLICRQDSNDPKTTYPRHVCIDGGNLYVGTESGTIGIYRVQQTEEQTDS